MRTPSGYVSVLSLRPATRVRLHQARFRGRVLTAYRDSCAICRLKELRLLDAAHIVGDAQPAGEPLVSNGLSLCSILVDKSEAKILGQALDLRNASGHPTKYTLGEKKVSSFIEDVIGIVWT